MNFEIDKSGFTYLTEYYLAKKRTFQFWKALLNLCYILFYAFFLDNL